jgi:serine/threonine protein kinase
VVPPANLIPGYEILGELGRGTTGVVYEARHLTLNRRVALKLPFLTADFVPSGKAERFRRECEALACLTSKSGVNIPALHEIGVMHDQPYCVRELVHGSTLENRVADHSIDLRTGLNVLAEIGRVVQWVHDRGLAHRNLLPANVLVATAGPPKLIGFGRVGCLGGSERLPPGSVSGVSPAIDVHALQAMLEWLCGSLGQPVPARLQRIEQGYSIRSAMEFADYLAACQ